MIYNGTYTDYKKVCSPCTIYVLLFAIILIISTIISSLFIYFHWYLKTSNTNTITNINANTETVIC